MVSVSFLLVTVLIIFSFIIILDWFFFNKKLISLSEFKLVVFTKNLNILYIYMLLFFLSIFTINLYLFLVFLFMLVSYSQTYTWSLGFEDQWKKLISVITEKTFFKDIFSLNNPGITNFKKMISDSVEEVKVVFGFSEPQSNRFIRLKEILKLYKRVFKYKKFDFIEMANLFNTEEKIKKASVAEAMNRNPNIILNSLRRLPWKLSYTEESDFFFKYFFKHTSVFYNFIKTTLVSLLLVVIYFLYTIFFFKIQFLKQLAVWFIIGMLYFWLMSGFNFFIKRYQYGKFTSQIQRFWKRTNMSFWLIEGFLILIFFYYYLNSSQEPMYMYDYSALNQEFLISLQVIGVNIILLSLVIYFMYFTLLRINSNSWSQINLYLVIISVFIFFSFFIETYQFYYVISTFNERLWVFNEEENLWVIETDNPILRTKHQYLFVCLIAKYWHFLFIFLSWVFFLIKSFEKRKITYVLFGANLQNIVLLYVLNFACYLQWFKWVYRRFFDLPYTWFFTNIDNKFSFRLLFEIKLLLTNLFKLNEFTTSFHTVVYKSLFIWNVDSMCMWKFL